MKLSIDLCEPQGWIVVPIKNIRDSNPIRAFMLQIAVISNHQNGRDTHMRQIRIHSPVETKRSLALEKFNEYSTVEFQQFATIRWKEWVKCTERFKICEIINSSWNNIVHSVRLLHSKMIFQSCMLIFIFNFIVKIHCDEISLLKEYFTTSLIEENRDILSQPLTQEIEDLINHKIEGFRSLIASPLIIGNRRTKRDASNNEISPKNECKWS